LSTISRVAMVATLASQLIACSGVDFSSKSGVETDVDGQSVDPNGNGDPKGLYKLPELIIENGEQYTNRDLVDVALISDFAIEMYYTNDPSCLTGGIWEPYEQDSKWVLQRLNTDVGVYAKVKFPNGQESGCVSDSIIHDNLPPALVFAREPKELQNNPLAQFEFTVTDQGSGVSRVGCQVGDGAMVDCLQSFVQEFADGKHKFRLFARDRAGNTAASDRNFEVDTVPPVVNLTSGPYNPSNTTRARFEFTVDDESATTTCLLNIEEGQACLSGDEFVADQGNNELRMRAVDPAGNVGYSRTHKWYVDSLAPAVTITAGPDDPTSQVQAQFEFVVDDPTADVKCSLNGSTYLLCTTGEGLEAKEGQNNFRVQATDPYGNIGYSRLYEWYLDSVGPAITITSGPENPSTTKESIFEFTTNDPTATYSCILNDREAVACETGDQFVAEEGENSFYIIGRDQLGNEGRSDNYDWFVDTEAPTVTITSGPNELTNHPVAVFEFQSPSDPEATFECKLNDGDSEACETGDEFETSLEGENTFTVVAIDPYGNRSAPSAPYSWTLDRTAPEVIFLAGPESPSEDLRADFTYEVKDDSELNLETLGCYLGEVQIECPNFGEFSTELAAEGENTLTVSISDRAGNIGQADTKWTYQPKAPDPDPDPDCLADTFVQPKDTDQKKLDVLFVVDTSGSMNSEKDAVANGINRFIEQLPVDTDYRLGVLLAHGVGSSYFGKLRHFYESGGVKEYVLTKDDSISFIRSKLKDALKNSPGQRATDGGEAGMASLHELLAGSDGDKLLLAQSQGILREEAALAVVFIADENDICAIAPDGVSFVDDPDGNEVPAFESNCIDPVVGPETVYQALKDVKGNQPLLVTGVIYNGDYPVPSGGENELGYGYLELIDANGSFSVDMAKPDLIDEGLADLGAFAREKLELLSEFILSRQPIKAESIEVKVDNVIVAAEFTQPNNVRIAIDNAGRAESVIEINYCLEPFEETIADTTY
jgi:hypothetical protein